MHIYIYLYICTYACTHLYILFYQKKVMHHYNYISSECWYHGGHTYIKTCIIMCVLYAFKKQTQVMNNFRYISSGCWYHEGRYEFRCTL